jgi:putative transposase
LEDLNMRGMQKLWGNKVGDLCHSEFIIKLEYIATKYGTNVVKVDRFYPSSKLCSICGYKHIGLRLIDREWDCPECGQHHDRDVNAAQNILREGILSWGSNSKTMLDSCLTGSCVDTRNPHLKVGEYVIKPRKKGC